MNDRRRENRKTEENDVSLGFINQKHAERYTEISPGRTKNLSLSGMNVICSRIYPVNTPLKIILPVRGNKTYILRIDGKVIWNLTEENSELMEAGIKFTDLSPIQSLILMEHLFGRPNLNNPG